MPNTVIQKSEHSQLEHSDIIPETMSEVEIIDKVLGFPGQVMRILNPGPFRTDRTFNDRSTKQEVREFPVGTWILGKIQIKIFTKILLMVSF